MKTKLTNGAFLLALIPTLLNILGQFGLMPWIPAWIGPWLIAGVYVLALLGIISDTNGSGVYNFAGVPLLKRLEEPTVLKAILSWIASLLVSLNEAFHWLPATVDVNGTLMALLAVAQIGGFVHGWSQIQPDSLAQYTPPADSNTSAQQ